MAGVKVQDKYMDSDNTSKTMIKKTILLLFLFVANITACMAQTVITHTIQRGETIESIAKKYGITVEELKKENPTLERMHYVGMSLKIPMTSQSKQKEGMRNVSIEKKELNTIKLSTPQRTIRDSNDREKSLSFFVDVFGGYSNFSWNDGSPVAGFGFGSNIGMQVDWLRIREWNRMCCELALGYSCRGSGAYPIHYVGTRLFPLSYKHSLSSDIKVVGKTGMYLALPLSRIETSQKTFDCNIDLGLSVALGIEYRRFGFSVLYEHGFPDVIDENVELHNRCAFLSFSYRI